MDFSLVRPCPNCPFRCDRPGFLRRADEIAASLAQGGTFTCHKTTEAVENDHGGADMIDGENAQMCAGALSVMEKDPHGPNQMMRIAERLGMYDPERLDKDAPTFSSLREFIAHHEGECEPGQTPAAASDDDLTSTGEPCHVAERGCEAPAGWASAMGGAVENDEPKDTLPCVDCGLPVCGTCSESATDDRRRCAECADICVGSVI